MQSESVDGKKSRFTIDLLEERIAPMRIGHGGHELLRGEFGITPRGSGGHTLDVEHPGHSHGFTTASSRSGDVINWTPTE